MIYNYLFIIISALICNYIYLYIYVSVSISYSNIGNKTSIALLASSNRLRDLRVLHTTVLTTWELERCLHYQVQIQCQVLLILLIGMRISAKESNHRHIYIYISPFCTRHTIRIILLVI